MILSTLKNIFFLLFFILFTEIDLMSQERCGTVQVTKNREIKYPAYKKNRKNVNIETDVWIKENYNNKSIITIPVVVHVVWSNSNQNISDFQIETQINVLNQDYRRDNIDQINTPNVWQSIAADCEIEFCLAKIDPNGQESTGINRVQTNHGSFGMDNDIHTSSLGGADDWPNEDYLNIWVCDLEPGLLGYATPPSNWIGDGDGVVIGYKYFGTTGTVQAPYNKGRTTTHEIGHWLNLNHVWGDSWGANGCNADDNVSDTPNQEEENYNCPGFPHNAAACNTSDGDMFMNYMDYTNDACMNLFTEGQKARMLAAITQYRPNMLNHNLCNSHTNISESLINKKKLIKVIDFLGKELKINTSNKNCIYIYNDGSVEKKIILK